MNELQIFNNPEFGEIRAIEIDGEPWFVGKDVATALGYSNPRDALAKHVDSEDKRVSQIATPSGVQEMTIINQSGLYSLVLSSKLPDAKKFRRWVTADVLPSIRKHGGYIAATSEMTDDEIMARALMVANETIKRRNERISTLEAQAKIDRPKVLFADAVATAQTSILIGELAKLLKQNGVEIGQNRLFQWMRDNGYLIKRKGSDYNLPTQYSMERGLMEIKETSGVNPDGSIRVNKTPKVTGRGQQYFVERFLGDLESA